MDSSFNHRRHHSGNPGLLAATNDGVFLLDVGSDLEQSDAREQHPQSEQAGTPRRCDSGRQLSVSIQGFRSFDTSLMDEDEIPTRDAGLDLSFSNNASNRFSFQDDPDRGRKSPSSLGDQGQSSSDRGQRGLTKKKRSKSKRGRGREMSRNNNSLNFREKLQRFEKGEFSGQEEV